MGGIELAAVDLVAARGRDPVAVTRLYQVHAPALLRFFTAAVGGRRAAEDLTGTTLTAAIQALPGFRGELGQLGAGGAWESRRCPGSSANVRVPARGSRAGPFVRGRLPGNPAAPRPTDGGGVSVPIDDRDRVESVSALPRRTPGVLP
jgi:hypothetical protein